MHILMLEYLLRGDVAWPAIAAVTLAAEKGDRSGRARHVEAKDAAAATTPATRQILDADDTGQNVDRDLATVGEGRVIHLAQEADQPVEPFEPLGIELELGRLLLGINDEMVGPRFGPIGQCRRGSGQEKCSG